VDPLFLRLVHAPMLVPSPYGPAYLHGGQPLGGFKSK